ncbi:zinc-binding dehydrogenase, partial [Streptomyces sp. NPDC048279]|uniref:zinc-binding dehydrogenase n=1 Tax=Streptomyces sp. NPDC048279 TaxID=3154714 RepID=UPI00343246E8
GYSVVTIDGGALGLDKLPVRATVAGTFPLTDAAKAHEVGGTGRTTGKLVLVVD